MRKLVGLCIGMGRGILDKWNDMSENAGLGKQVQEEESKFNGTMFHGESLEKED